MVLLGLMAAAVAGQEPARPPGTRVELTVGELFVPEAYEAEDGKAHLLLHLHGAAWAAERNLDQWGESAVLVTVVLPGLSAVYKECFSDEAVLPRIIDETESRLAELGVSEAPRVDRVTVTSFSAGFGGVREMLKSEGLYARIDSLVMADSIHTGFVGDPAQRCVDPVAMEGFLRFARDATVGNKRMVITHSRIKPEAYASTTETADYLLAQLGGEREAADAKWAEGLHCTSRFERGNLSIFGFEGETGPDHMKHLHELWRFMFKLQREG